MSYDAATGTVIYRSKRHLGLKRNFQVMPGAQWLALAYAGFHLWIIIVIFHAQVVSL